MAMTSFNTFGRTSDVYGGSPKNIWYIVRERLLIGATVSNLSDFNVGDVIPAGSMLIVNEVAHTCEVVTAATVQSKAAQVNALLENDIYIDNAAVLTGGATATCVRRGTIYVDRCEVEIPASVQTALGNLIYFYHEA